MDPIPSLQSRCLRTKIAIPSLTTTIECYLYDALRKKRERCIIGHVLAVTAISTWAKRLQLLDFVRAWNRGTTCTQTTANTDMRLTVGFLPMLLWQSCLVKRPVVLGVVVVLCTCSIWNGVSWVAMPLLVDSCP